MRIWERCYLTDLSPGTRLYVERKLRKLERIREREEERRLCGPRELDEGRQATLDVLAGLRAEPSGFKPLRSFRGRKS